MWLGASSRFCPSTPMSESTSASDASTALGCRENFFDHDAEDYEHPERDAAADDASDYIDPSPPPRAAVVREEWTIDHYLRKHPEAQLFCPYCWHELNAEAELSGPESYVPESEVVTDPRYQLDPDPENPEAPTPEESVAIDELDYATRQALWTEPKYGDHRRHRHCNNCGGVSWGGVLGDLTTDQFLASIDAYLATKEHLLESDAEEVWQAARKRKQGGQADRDNRTEIAYHVARGVVSEEF